jgi:hypothetical protein
LESVKLGLCEGKYKLPAVAGYIFPARVNPVDIVGLETIAKSVLGKVGVSDIDIYATGISVTLVAALNAATDLGINVRLLHYNTVTKEYYPQIVKRCL